MRKHSSCIQLPSKEWKTNAIPQNDIPVNILKGCRDILSQYFQKLFNASIIHSRFPNKLKLAEVSPAYKKDEIPNKQNYRPISILPTVSKMFGRVIYNQISSFMLQDIAKLMEILEKETNLLHDWFTHNYLILNNDKSKLLSTHEKTFTAALTYTC